jgi:glycosyltransferase involved in cell wall biosynthesis
MQLKISYVLSKIGAQTDLWLFYIGGDCLVLPMLVAKLFRRRVFLVCAGSATETLIASGDLFSLVTRLLSSINCKLADRLILYSPLLVEKWGLERYDNKTIIASRHILDFNKLRIIKGLTERDELVGYVGRFSEEKGVFNFIEAISFIKQENDRVHFSIAGEGHLREEIEKSLIRKDLQDRVSLRGWVEHDNIADHLNRLKLVVIPSFTEGLPNLMLEAMACGTPVLATAAGAITDVITDGETGFIMEKNLPECIAANVKRALKHSAMDDIVKNARRLVEREYGDETIIRKWNDVFSR